MTNSAGDLLNAAKEWRDALRALYTDAIATGLRVTAWAKGSPTRALYYSVARSIATLTKAVQDIANQGFRTTAKGEALTLNAREVFGVRRPGATYASTTLYVTNTAGGNYPWSPNAPLIVLNTAKNKQYLSQGSGVIAPLATSVPVPVIALEPGSASTALPDEIDAFVTAADGLVISQPNPAIGVDAMSDEDLCAAGGARVGFVPTASTIGAGGAPGAFESVVRAGPDGGGGVLRLDGTRIAITRVRVLDDGAGGVSVIVADQDGPIGISDLGYVNAAVKAYATPVGMAVAAAVNATTLNQAITYTAYVPASAAATDADIKAAAIEGITAYFERVPIGGYELEPGIFYIPIDGIRRAIANAVAALIGETVAVTVTTPAGDLSAAATAVPVLSGTPTATIVRVPNT